MTDKLLTIDERDAAMRALSLLITEEHTIGATVARFPETRAVFDAYGVTCPCCQRRSIADGASDANVEPSHLLFALRASVILQYPLITPHDIAV